MPRNGQTALVIPVPAADALLGSVENRHPGTVRAGVPAHVSLLWPFVGAAELDERVTEGLSELVAGHGPMPVEFGECYRRGGFIALRPDPIEGLTELTRRTHDRWPALLPYEGRYGDVEPHLTIATRASEETAVTIEQEVSEQLPISAELCEVWLMAFEKRWTLRRRFALGSSI